MHESGNDHERDDRPSTERKKRPINRHRIAWAIFMALLGVAMFLGIVFIAGSDRIDAIRHADPTWTLIAILSGIAVTTVSTLRWGHLTNLLAGRVVLPWHQYYVALLTSRVLGLFVPRNASDLGVRIAVLMGPGRLGGEFATASVALDQLFDIVLLGVWLLPSILLLGTLPGTWAYILVPLALAVSLVLMLRLSAVVTWVARLLERMAKGLSGTRRAGPFFGRRSEGLSALAEIEHFTTTQGLQLGSATILRYGFNALMFWSISEALGLGIDAWFFLLAGPIVQLSLVVAFTPGALGVMDLGWIGTLALAGYDTADGAAFVVGLRAFQYLFFPILAAASYFAALIWRSFGTNDHLRSDTPEAPR